MRVHYPSFSRTIVSGFAFFLAFNSLRAQSAGGIDPGIQALDRQQRDDQDRMRQEEQQRELERQKRATHLDVVPPKISQPKVSKEVKFLIKEVRLEGATLLASEVRSQVRTQFTGRELGVEDIQQLFGLLMRYYFIHGYATTRVYLPEQDLSSGILRVAVVEGHIEGFVLREPGRPDRTPPANMIPAYVGGFLNLRDLERGVDNFNRLSSDQATLDLIPGSKPGETVVGIRNVRSRPWHLEASIDNTGSADTGRVQGSVTVTTDDLTGYYDSFMLNYRRSLPYDGNRSGSQAYSSSFSLPLGYYTFTLGGSFSTYALSYYAPSGFALLFDGNSKSAYAKLDRLFFQDTRGRLSASATLTWKSTSNYLLHSLIDTSSRKLAVLDLAASYGKPVWGGAFTVSPGVSFGLPVFGALRDPSGIPGIAPHAQFAKLVLNATYMRSFEIAHQSFSISSSLSSQYAFDTLYGSEQLTVSGLYATRGFDRTSLAGDHGYVWRNDLSWNLSFPGPLGGRLGSKLGVRPYVGIDQGHAWSRIHSLPGVSDFTQVAGPVAGATVGIGLNLGRLDGDISYSRELDRPSFMPVEGQRVVARLSASY